MTGLPIDAVLPAIDRHLDGANRLIIEAAPGAGKSTRVPPHLLDAGWLEGRRVLLLEPRRIAARNLAAFLAEQAGEVIGGRVGLHIRDERRSSDRTRLEVLTEGMLVRRLQSDPELGDVGAVIFDEYHERHLQTDLGLALALDVQESLREDLRIILMSATLDTAKVGAWLNAPVVSSSGRSHPVDVGYRPPRERRATPIEVAAAAREALAAGAGDVLVFLPGRREIEQSRAALSNTPAEVRPLYGALPLAEQRRALAPGDQQRIVLATNIAESSLTVPGVTAVVDAGLERAPAFDARSGLTRLVERRISADSATQRSGRAGRLSPGLCLRLWPESERLVPRREPEIRSADLAGLVLELAAWGTDADGLRWFDAPAVGALAQARELLRLFGAIDAAGHLTERGRTLQRWGTEPRLAAMLSIEDDEFELAVRVVALLEGRDPMPEGNDDLRHRLDAWRSGRLPKPVQASLDREADRWRRRGRGAKRAIFDSQRVGAVLARGLPDRVARARSDARDRYQLVNGRGVRLGRDSSLAGTAWLVVSDARLEERDSLVRLAAPIDEADVLAEFGDRLERSRLVTWDDAAGAVVAEEVTSLGAIVLKRQEWPDAPADAVVATLLGGIRKRGLASLPWSAAARGVLARCRCVHHHDPTAAPDWSEATLRATLDAWLGPHVFGKSRLSHLQSLDLRGVLTSNLGYDGLEALRRLAPESIPIASGRNATIDYGDPERPVLAVKLQELFGKQPPLAVLGGRVPLTLHLLSPAGRPLQVTQDLEHFWDNAYIEVAKEMRGRYPKHPWPDDPRSAVATARTKRALGKDGR